MLSIVMLSVVMLNVIMLSVVVPFHKNFIRVIKGRSKISNSVLKTLHGSVGPIDDLHLILLAP